jgi:hypothetical protein
MATGAPAATATGEPRHTLPYAHDVMKAVHTLAVAVKRRPFSITVLSVVSWTTTGVPQPPDHVVDVSPSPDRDVITEPGGEEVPVVMKGPAVPS